MVNRENPEASSAVSSRQPCAASAAFAATMKSGGQARREAAAYSPAIAIAIVQIATRIDRMIAQLESDKVSEKTARALTHADEVLTSLGVTVKRIEQSGITDKTSRTLDDL